MISKRCVGLCGRFNKQTRPPVRRTSYSIQPSARQSIWATSEQCQTILFVDVFDMKLVHSFISFKPHIFVRRFKDIAKLFN